MHTRALGRAGPRLEEINQRLPALEAAVRPIRAQRDALLAVGGHIDRAVGPAAAVLKVFDAVHGLERSLLSDPRSDLAGYLSVVKRLEEALKFLAENCALAIQWLGDIVEYLEDNSVADERYLSNLKKSLDCLRELQDSEGDERAHGLDGGLLDVALDKLEGEFRRLLVDHGAPPLQMQQPADENETPCIAPSPLPGVVVQKLQAVLDRLIANGRLDRCIAIYTEVRSANARASLRALNLDYLEISTEEFNGVQSIEGYIVQWGRHLEFAVKHLFELEYRLCGEVLERIGTDAWTECFAQIALQTGMLDFLRFGKTVTESKKDPIKLVKMLDIFASMNKLRLDFNRLFRSKACNEIQSLTRDLVKRLVEGVCDIFWELIVQVELQRQMPPPADGGVPKLVSFITSYCNQLLGDNYRPLLNQVLDIQRSWQKEKFQEGLLNDAILNVVRALEGNLEIWSKAYEDTALVHLFMMNCHWHFSKHLKGTKLGNLMGESWLQDHEHFKEYFLTLYLKETWGKLPALLSREGLIYFYGGRATARDLVKKRLKAFNEVFDELYRKHMNWVVSEKDLRERVCQSAVQAIVPVYRSYMQNYGPLVEQDASSSKYSKYSPQSLEKMVGSLFQLKPAKQATAKARHSNGKVNPALVTNQFCSAPTAV
ncbi:Exocyst complex component [Nymphaea thermarum]|nr:Exocyst complex component [Nymphaea thermarum]